MDNFRSFVDRKQPAKSHLEQVAPAWTRASYVSIDETQLAVWRNMVHVG